MKLKDFLKYLETTALTGINLGRNTTAGITANNHVEIIGHLNDTIQRLFTEFPDNRHHEVYIDLHDEINFYTLDYEYAQSNTNSTQPVKYIADTAENPFNKEVMQIIAAYNEVGVELDINNLNTDDGIFVVDFKTIQVLKPVTGNTIVIIYQAGPGRILTDIENYLDQEVDIPSFALYLAKLDIITHILMNRKTAESEIEANKYMQLYQMELQRLKDKGYRITEGTRISKLEDRGWL